MTELIAWFTTNWTVIEGLARNLAADLATLWALGLALAQVLKKFWPVKGDNLQSKLVAPFTVIKS
jgi:hypothetical protein